jgi:hypothetical protein
MWEFKKAILKTSSIEGYPFTLCYDETCAYSACTGCGVPDRSVVKSKNVLIVYDPNSTRPDLYSYDVNPSDIATTIQTRETSLTFTATTITSYTAFEALSDATIANYSHIWDIGYDTLITSSVATKYETYLLGGGAMFLLGENGAFVDRDTSITNFITDMGGGIVSSSPQQTGTIVADVAAEFRIANTTATVTFNNVGKFGVIGTGTILADSVNGIHAAIWETGDLSSVPTAAIVSVLDINFLVGTTIQQEFIDNISLTLNNR